MEDEAKRKRLEQAQQDEEEEAVWCYSYTEKFAILLFQIVFWTAQQKAMFERWLSTTSSW
jgi:hypothetical protein